MQKEVMAFEKLNVWKCHPNRHKMSKECQKAHLRIIFDVNKEELRRKARHFMRFHNIDSEYLESCSSVVQSMSIRS